MGYRGAQQVADKRIELLRLEGADRGVAPPEARRSERLAESAARTAVDDEVHIPQRARAAGRRRDHEPTRTLWLLEGAEAPRRPDTAVRLRHQLLEDAGIQDLAADRHPFAQMVEERAIDTGANLGARLAKQGMRCGKE